MAKKYDSRASRDVHATVTWKDHDDFGGSTYEWPQGTKDNRPSRVRARMARYGMDETADMATVRIQHHRQNLNQQQFGDQPVVRTGGRTGPGTTDSSKIIVDNGARRGFDGMQGGRL